MRSVLEKIYKFQFYLKVRAQEHFNLVFFLQLYLMHKDKMSKECESYTDSFT